MLHCVVLVRTDVLEERIVSIVTVTTIGELRRTLAVTGNRSTQRATRRNIPEHGILHSECSSLCCCIPLLAGTLRPDWHYYDPTPSV
jgi:hypothetical protein